MSETIVPKLSTTLTPMTAPATGTPAPPSPTRRISATLNGGSSPTGTITFNVFGPQTTAPTTCTSGGTAVGSGTTVSGDGTYNPTVGFNPPSAGDYWWYASYGGDTNNNAAASTCGSGMSETVVAKASPTLTAAGPGTGTVGTAIAASSVSATLSGGSGRDRHRSRSRSSGRRRARPPPARAAAPPSAPASPSRATRPTTRPRAYTPSSAGDYWWYASYGGDTNNNAAASTCGSGMTETVVAKAHPTLTAAARLGHASAPPSPPRRSRATLSGGSSPTGAVTFTVFGPQASAPTTCTSGGTAVGTGRPSPATHLQPDRRLHALDRRRLLVVRLLRRRHQQRRRRQRLRRRHDRDRRDQALDDAHAAAPATGTVGTRSQPPRSASALSGGGRARPARSPSPSSAPGAAPHHLHQRRHQPSAATVSGTTPTHPSRRVHAVDLAATTGGTPPTRGDTNNAPPPAPAAPA